MKAHGFDPISFLFGLLFAGIGLAFLVTDRSVGDIAPTWLFSVPLLVVGSVAVIVGMRRAMARGNGDREPNNQRPDGSAEEVHQDPAKT